MSIDAEVSLVVLVTKGTPHSFEMKHVEICVSIHFFKYVYGQFVFVMCKGTDFTIFTLVNFFRICWAELWFVLLRVVEILNSIVATNAIVTFGTLFFWITTDMRTHFRNVATRATSPVLLVWFMVVKTLFRIMCSLVLARLCLKHVEIQQLHNVFFLWCIKLDWLIKKTSIRCWLQNLIRQGLLNHWLLIERNYRCSCRLHIFR